MSDLRVDVVGPVLAATIDRESRRNVLSAEAMRGAGLMREVVSAARWR